MTAHEIHALSGAYAVDALDDLERTRFEQHLAVCPECRAEVASLRESAAQLGELNAVTPPPALRDRLLADIARIRPLPPEVPAPATPASTPVAEATRRRAEHRRPSWRMLGAAAAVLTVVGVGTVVTVEQLRDDQTQTLSAADRVLRAPDARSVSVQLPRDASARVVVSDSQRRAVLITNNMPAAPDGKVYELWLQDPGGAMVPAGLMQAGGNQEVVLEGDAAAATAVGITVEPTGGSPEPTSAPIALFEFARAS